MSCPAVWWRRGGVRSAPHVVSRSASPTWAPHQPQIMPTDKTSSAADAMSKQLKRGCGCRQLGRALRGEHAEVAQMGIAAQLGGEIRSGTLRQVVRHDRRGAPSGTCCRTDLPYAARLALCF